MRIDKFMFNSVVGECASNALHVQQVEGQSEVRAETKQIKICLRSLAKARVYKF